MASKVHETCVIKAPAEKVWDAVRNLDFKWSKSVKGAKPEGDVGVGGSKVVTYAGGDKVTEQELKVIGLDDAKMSVTWDIISSNPSVQYMSCIHTIRLHRVTETNETFFEWITDFSIDATQEILQDCRYKRKEAFAEIAAHFK